MPVFRKTGLGFLNPNFLRSNFKTVIMKKLKLKLKGVGEILTKEQLKKITGGYPVCGLHCETSNGGNCYNSTEPNGGQCIHCDPYVQVCV